MFGEGEEPRCLVRGGAKVFGEGEEPRCLVRGRSPGV